MTYEMKCTARHALTGRMEMCSNYISVNLDVLNVSGDTWEFSQTFQNGTAENVSYWAAQWCGSKRTSDFLAANLW